MAIGIGIGLPFRRIGATNVNPEFIKHYSFDGIDDIGIVADNDLFDSPNLILNYSFETFTGVKDSGNSVDFANWTKTNNTATNIQAVTGINGTTMAKLILETGKIAIIRQTISVVQNTEYILRFKYQNSNVIYRGRYLIYDATNSANIVTTQTLPGYDTPFGILEKAFITPAGCTSIRIDLIAPSTQVGEYVHIDEVVLSLPYSLSVAFYLKRQNMVSFNIERDYFVSRLWNDGDNNQRSWSIRSIGDEGKETDQGKLRFSSSKTGDSNSSGVYSVTKPATDTWYHVSCIMEYLGYGRSNYYMFINGIKESELLYSEGYAWNGYAPLTFAGLQDPTLNHYADCSIAQIQIAKRAFTPEEVLYASKGGILTNCITQYLSEGIDTDVWNDAVNNLNAVITGATIINP